MKKALILSVMLVVSSFIIGCPNDPTLNCTPLYQCADGSWLEGCVSFDSTRTAFKYHGQYYTCTSSYCMDAMQAVYSCLGYIPEDLGVTDQEQAVDESLVDMQAE